MYLGEWVSYSGPTQPRIWRGPDREMFGRMEAENPYGFAPGMMAPGFLRGYLGEDDSDNYMNVFTGPPEPVETMPMPIPGELEYPPAPSSGISPLTLLLGGLSLLSFFASNRRKK